MYTKIKYKQVQFKLFAILMAFFAVTFVGCADLDEDPGKSRLAPGSYSTIEELDLGVTGIYSQLHSASQWSTFMVAGWAGDDITTHKVSNKADFREFDQRAVSNENSRIYNNWRDIYAMIRAANNVLESADGLETSDSDKQNRLLGEIYFLRGTLFFHLARVHERIPLPLTSLPELDITLSSRLEVMQQVESDLLQAEQLLPDIYPGVLAGAPRPNNGSARALLARLYMDWAGFPLKDASKYQDAFSSAEKVINSAGSHGFALVNDLEDLWVLANRFNSESVWTISYSKSFSKPNRKFGKLGHPGDKLGWGETFAEIRYFEDMPEGPRKEATYRTEYEWEAFSDQKTPVYKKIVGPEGDISLNDFNTDRNDFYMRYAEVLLIYSEASGHLGQVTDNSWEYLNMIRRRAEGLPYATAAPSVDITSGDIVELTFEERKWELAGEWLRWNDLVRLEKVQEALSQRNPRSSYNPDTGALIPVQNAIIGSLGTDNYFAPVPARVMAESPSLGN